MALQRTFGKISQRQEHGKVNCVIITAITTDNSFLCAKVWYIRGNCRYFYSQKKSFAFPEISRRLPLVREGKVSLIIPGLSCFRSRLLAAAMTKNELKAFNFQTVFFKARRLPERRKTRLYPFSVFPEFIE